MCWKIWAHWPCQTLPPCWDMNCWPYRDSFGVSSTLKKTSNNNNNNEDTDFRECCCSFLRLKTPHFSFSEIWTLQTCMWQAIKQVFTVTGIQMGKHFYGRTTVSWNLQAKPKKTRQPSVTAVTPSFPFLSLPGWTARPCWGKMSHTVSGEKENMSQRKSECRLRKSALNTHQYNIKWLRNQTLWKCENGWDLTRAATYKLCY